MMKGVRLLKHLFTSCYINKLEIKNRIVMPSMHLNYAPGGEINEKIIEFYLERARGGAGLIIVGGCAIDDVGAGPLMIDVSDPRFLEGLHRLTGKIKKEGTAIAAQLYHAGRYAYSFLTGKQSVAPSAIASRLTRETPHELSNDEIQELMERYVSAALLVKEAEFDAVEILASAGYIISQFLSPQTNRRNDRYGGDFKGRMRFGLEVVSKVKEAVGPEYPVIVRVGGNDFIPGGNTNVEIREFCRHLENVGADCLNVTGGWHETRVPQLTMVVPPGTFVYLAENIKNDVSLPVVACNRINDPRIAAKIIEEKRADFVGMARPLIADPQLPAKAAGRNPGRIRKCIGCNQGCLDKVFSLQEVTCLVNAAAGREKETKIEAAAAPRKILVIGGGVAGMEAARVSAARGHEVTLWEKGNELGGQIKLAAAPPGRNDFLDFHSYLEGEIEALGVKVVLDRAADAGAIIAENADVVVLATGAEAIRPDIPGIDRKHVCLAEDVLMDRVETGGKVVVVGGGAVGVETALHLSQKGALSAESLKFLLLARAEKPEDLYDMAVRGPKDITIMEMEKGIGRDIGISTRWTLLDALRRADVKMMENTTVKSIEDEGIIAEAEGEEIFTEADTVVIAVGSMPVNKLYEELKGKVEHLHLIGDARKPGKALDAVRDAFDLALKI
jgi:2,4-dienoyl-CoA reductase (NADPH2)